jgi:hypothetical protein
MSNPIFYRLMVLLAKIEGTYAVDPTLTGASNALLAKNLTINPMDGTDISRDLIQNYLGNKGSIPAELKVTLQFDTEIAGSGTAGTAPAWGILARGAGCAEVIVAATSVTYSPISTGFESTYFKFWLDQTLHAFKGGRMNAKATLNAQGIPVINWSVTGLFVDPLEATSATPVFTAWKAPLIVTNTNTPIFTVNGVSLVMRNFSFDLGNKVEARFLVGRESIDITDRREAIDIACEAVPLSAFNPFSLAKAQTLVSLVLRHGTAAGNIATINAPTCQLLRPKGFSNEQGVAFWQLPMAPQPNAGNDQFSIVLT